MTDKDLTEQSSRFRRGRAAMMATAVGTAGVLAGVLALVNSAATAGTVAPAAPGTSNQATPAAPARPSEPAPRTGIIQAEIVNPVAEAKLEVFSQHVKTQVPQVMPGWVTQEITYYERTKWNFTGHYFVLWNKSGGPSAAMEIRVFDPASAKHMPKPPADCPTAAAGQLPTSGKPLCQKQSDGSTVLFTTGTIRDTTLPTELFKPEGEFPEMPAQPALIAKHYRANGSLVEAWGILDAVDAVPSTVFSTEQLTKFATDPALTF